MGKIRNVTFEQSRQRYVFQMRVPRDISKAFEGRTHVRVALGGINEDQAAKRAEELTAQWTRKFDAARKRRSPLRSAQPLAKVQLTLDAENALRVVATRRLITYTSLKEKLSLLRSGNDAVWEDALVEAECRVAAARERLVRGRTDDVFVAIESIMSSFSVKIDHSGQSLDEFAELLNADTVKLAKEWVAVLRGELTLDALRPATDALLPLTRFFGTSASALLPAWRQRLELIGKAVRSKTIAKYESILDDLAAVLEDVPVERLTKDHVQQLSSLWRDRDNDPATISAKFSTIASLMGPITQDSTTLLKSLLPRTHLSRARRLPFTVSQLSKLREALANDISAHEDDLMLLDLMMLTGARLGELLQLRTADVRPFGALWVIDIGADADDTLKTPGSRRSIPVSTENTHELERWIVRRREAGGPLFGHAIRDKHGHYGCAESKRINATIRGLHSDKRLVLESVRNTVARTLRADGVDPRVRRGLLGHADIDVHEQHYDPEGLLTAEDFLPAVPVLVRLAAQTRDASVQQAE